MTSPFAPAVAAYGLPTGHRLPREPLDDLDFEELLGECVHHRIVGLLGTAVRDGAVPVTESQRSSLESTWQAWLGHALRAEQLLLAVTTVLADHGLRSIVLKGVALAHTVYREPSMRVFGDLDLLIEPHHFSRAASVLAAELGAERPLPELKRGFDDRFGKEILLRASGLELDLHRMFVEGPYGIATDLADLWSAPEPFTVGGREILALAPPVRVVHAAYAAALGDWPLRLGSLRDFVETWWREPETLEAGFELARRWRCDAVVTAASEHAQHVLDTDVHELNMPRHGRPSVRDRIFLASYRGFGRGYLYNLIAPITVRGLANKVRYLSAIAFPDPRYLAARGTTRKRFIQQAWEKVRAGRGSG